MSDVLIGPSHQFPKQKQDLTRIHVIGDSHTLVFGKSRLFTVHHIGPATAYNLKNKNSSTKSNQKLFELIEKFDKFKDIAILVFGEIDCRIHIYYKYMANNETISISELIDKTIFNYGVVLKQLKDMDIAFLVYGIPAAGFEENVYKYPFYASPEIMKTIFYEFNNRLKDFCEKNNYKYINIYPIVSDKNGFLLREYLADDVHLNEKIIPFIEVLLSKEYKREIHSNSISEGSLGEVTAVETFEIRDEEIDVEEIMRKIRENIKRRKETGAYPEDEIKELNKPFIETPKQISNNSYISGKKIDEDLEVISSICDLSDNNYIITSHRPVVGKAMIKGRKLVHGEVRRYIDPILSQQTEFNNLVVKILYKLATKNDELVAKNDELSFKINKILDSIDTQRNTISAEIKGVSRTLDIDYIKFNNIHGGTNEQLKYNSKQFLNFFAGCKNVLDIGSGRGIFLELLKEKEIGGYGIDINDNLVAYCRNKGLNVYNEDAISHLERLDDESLDGIFITHVIEHLINYELIYLIKLCYKKLVKGSNMVIAMPNILSMSVSANRFYIDPTHINHVHPEAIKFLLSSNGFLEIQERFYQPFDEKCKLKRIEIDKMSHTKEPELPVQIINYNIDKLNEALFGCMDYAVVAKK